MKAISIKNPHISKLITGTKQYEFRNWKTSYRGEIVLCSSKRPDKDHPASDAPRLIFPDGYALAIGVLSNIYTTDELGIDNGFKYSFCIKDITLIRPTPIKGKLGIFDLPAKILIKCVDNTSLV